MSDRPLRYEALGAFLRAQSSDVFVLSLDDIAKLVDGLPKGAQTHQFWVNAIDHHTSRRGQWLNNGYHAFYDGRTTRHSGYVASQRIRKRIEEGFGWMKTIAGLRKTKYRGLERVRRAFTLAAAAYNLIRLPKLMAPA